jgi:hypothetical protein
LFFKKFWLRLLTTTQQSHEKGLSPKTVNEL